MPVVYFDSAFKLQRIVYLERRPRIDSPEHGAPLRLRVENQPGYKMVKWISFIEFLETHETTGKGFGGKNEDAEYFGLLANT